MPKSEKEEKPATFYRILPKIKQVIYTMGTVYTPNIMILA